MKSKKSVLLLPWLMCLHTGTYSMEKLREKKTLHDKIIPGANHFILHTPTICVRYQHGQYTFLNQGTCTEEAQITRAKHRGESGFSFHNVDGKFLQFVHIRKECNDTASLYERAQQSLDPNSKTKVVSARIDYHKELGRTIFFYDEHFNCITHSRYMGGTTLSKKDKKRLGQHIDLSSLNTITDNYQEDDLDWKAKLIRWLLR